MLEKLLQGGWQRKAGTPFLSAAGGIEECMLTPPHWHKSPSEDSFLLLASHHAGPLLSSPFLLRGCRCPTHPALEKTHPLVALPASVARQSGLVPGHPGNR